MAVLFYAVAISAQTNSNAKVEGAKLQYLGKSAPLKELSVKNALDPDRRAKAKANKPKYDEVPNFINRNKKTKENLNALPVGADPVRQTNQTLALANNFVVEPVVNVDGINQIEANVLPPDPNGDMSSDYYVQTVNATYIQIFDTEGNELTDPFPANTLWNEFNLLSGGDPVVFYDQGADRWIITEFGPPSGGPNVLLIAVSETNDPTGSFYAYAFNTEDFPDYPKYAVWPNAYTITSNEPGADPVYTIYVLDRAAMLNGEDDVDFQRVRIDNLTNHPGISVLTPINWNGPTPPPADSKPGFLAINDDSWGSTPTDQLEYYEIDIDWDNPDNTVVTGPTPILTAPFETDACDFDDFPWACAPQPNGASLSIIPRIIMHRVHYRNFGTHESVVLNFTVDANGENVAGVRWIELRRSTADDPWNVYQEGTYAPEDGLYRFMGGIAIDAKGNIGLAYCVSGDTLEPSLRFTGRRYNDPLGQMTVKEYQFADGLSSQLDFIERYGDYSSMVVQPGDERTFWFTGEYMLEDDFWGTKIVAFRLQRDTNDIGPFAMLTPVSAGELTDTEVVSIEVRNFGIDTQQVFTIGYSFENGPAYIDTVTMTLLPDSTYSHTFTETVDMSENGVYNFTFFTSLDGDENPFNDTLRVNRTNFPRNDAGIENIFGLPNILCADNVDIQFLLKNFAIDTLKNVDITIELDGNVIETLDWQGELAASATTTIDYSLTNIPTGLHNLAIYTSFPNGEMDEVTTNDTIFRAFETSDSLFQTLTLELTTDSWPSETTWELQDDEGNILFSGGPYFEENTLFIHEWCLKKDSCYTFIIFDSYGDGIPLGDGNYEIKDDQGNVIASIIQVNFGFEEVNEFCFACTLTTEISTSPISEAGANDGAISIVVQNGAGPFQFSIDGGNTFHNENFFDNLAPGIYNIVVLDAAGCEFTDEVELETCALQLMADVTNATVPNNNDGEITLTASGSSGFIQYSIDGGNTFSFSNVFSGLPSGMYQVVARDDLGCFIEITVEIELVVSSQNIVFGHTIQLMPNPTDGVFKIIINGLPGVQRMPITILDNTGKAVQHGMMTRYGQRLASQFSLIVYPAGIYYVRFEHEAINQIIPVVKR